MTKNVVVDVNFLYQLQPVPGGGIGVIEWLPFAGWRKCRTSNEQTKTDNLSSDERWFTLWRRLLVETILS